MCLLNSPGSLGTCVYLCGDSQVVIVVKNPPTSSGEVGVMGLIPGLGRSPGGGCGNPLQYFCLENPLGQRSLAGYSPWCHKESDMTEHAWTHVKPTQTYRKRLHEIISHGPSQRLLVLILRTWYSLSLSPCALVGATTWVALWWGPYGEELNEACQETQAWIRK